MSQRIERTGARDEMNRIAPTVQALECTDVHFDATESVASDPVVTPVAEIVPASGKNDLATSNEDDDEPAVPEIRLSDMTKLLVVLRSGVVLAAQQFALRLIEFCVLYAEAYELARGIGNDSVLALNEKLEITNKST